MYINTIGIGQVASQIFIQSYLGKSHQSQSVSKARGKKYALLYLIRLLFFYPWMEHDTRQMKILNKWKILMKDIDSYIAKILIYKVIKY